jgi:AcrR family transcriptional regulator
MPRGRTRDTSRHAAFLIRVAEGASFKRAIGLLGLTERGLYHHFRDDPEFHAAALQAREEAGTPPTGTPPSDTSWVGDWLDLLRDGHSWAAAARACGIAYHTVQHHLRSDATLRAAADEARPVRRRSARQPGRTPRDGDVARVVALLQAGLSLAQALWVLDINVNGFRRWVWRQGRQAEIRTCLARRDAWPVDETDLMELCRMIASGMDLKVACVAALIVAAAAADGRTHPIRPIQRLQCPGPHCDMKTGYDYGCRQSPCKARAVESVKKSRETR